MLKSGLTLPWCLALTACVTTHQNPPTKGSNASFLASCNTRGEVQTDYFRIINCTIENTGDDWLDVKVENVTMLPETTLAKVSSAREIGDLAKAYSYSEAQSDHNIGAGLATLAVAGFVAAAAGGGGNTSGAGAAAIVTSTSISSFRSLSKAHDQAEHAGKPAFTNDHLLGDGFSVPPGLFTRKQLVIQIRRDAEQPEALRVCFEAPAKECMDLDLDRTIERRRSIDTAYH